MQETAAVTERAKSHTETLFYPPPHYCWVTHSKLWQPGDILRIPDLGWVSPHFSPRVQTPLENITVTLSVSRGVSPIENPLGTATMDWFEHPKCQGVLVSETMALWARPTIPIPSVPEGFRLANPREAIMAAGDVYWLVSESLWCAIPPHWHGQPGIIAGITKSMLAQPISPLNLTWNISAGNAKNQDQDRPGCSNSIPTGDDACSADCHSKASNSSLLSSELSDNSDRSLTGSQIREGSTMSHAVIGIPDGFVRRSAEETIRRADFCTLPEYPRMGWFAVLTTIPQWIGQPVGSRTIAGEPVSAEHQTLQTHAKHLQAELSRLKATLGDIRNQLTGAEAAIDAALLSAPCDS